MTWWYWLVLGLVLIALEMASAGGFYIIFFGVAGVVVALLAATGIWRSRLAAVAALLSAVGRLAPPVPQSASCAS